MLVLSPDEARALDRLEERVQRLCDRTYAELAKHLFRDVDLVLGPDGKPVVRGPRVTGLAEWLNR